MEQLKRMISESGLRHDRIARHIGVTKEHLSYMLNGHRNMSDKYKMAIIEFCKRVAA